MLVALLTVIALALISLAPSVGAVAPPLAKKGPTQCAVGQDPYYPAYDPVNHDLYVPNSASHNISVLSGTCTLVKTISLSSRAAPLMAAFNPANNDIYVTDNGLDRVYVISGTTLVHTLKGFSRPWGITYDPGDDVMLVANNYASYITAVRGTSIFATVPTGNGPIAIGYDPYFATLLVANDVSDNVTILNAVTLAHITDVAVGSGPISVVFDPANDWDYVTNEFSDNVTVLDGAGSVVGSVSGFNLPTGEAWDQASLRVQVVNLGSGELFSLNNLKVVDRNRTASGVSPFGVVYDEANDYVYVSASTSDLLYVFT